MSFAYPFVLWLLLPAALYLYRRPPKSVTVAADTLAALLLLFALASPYADKGVRDEAYEAREVILALDVSHSMRARDIAPDRYTYAKRLIEAFLKRDRSDAIGLIAFTTNPLLLAPPTTDHALVATALRALRIDDILTKGTSIRRLFRFLPKLEGDRRTLVLITDGGEERDAGKLAALLPAGTRLIIVALASQAGAPVPDVDARILRQTRTPLIVSRRNPMLNDLAALTDAPLLTPESSPQALANKLAQAVEQSQTRLHREKRRERTLLAWVFLLPALLLLFAAHTKAVRYLILLAALAHLPLHAGMLDDWRLMQAYRSYEAGDLNSSLRTLRRIDAPSLQRRYLHATLLYRLGRYKAAARMFLSIRTTAKRRKQTLLYNAATAYAKAGDYARARRYYVQALQLGDDNDTRANLAHVLFLRTHRTPQGRSKPASASSKPDTTSSPDEATQERASHSKASTAGANGGNSRTKASASAAKRRHKDTTPPATQLPLSSKVYDLINKGYIRETKPW